MAHMGMGSRKVVTIVRKALQIHRQSAWLPKPGVEFHQLRFPYLYSPINKSLSEYFAQGDVLAAGDSDESNLHFLDQLKFPHFILLTQCVTLFKNPLSGR